MLPDPERCRPIRRTRLRVTGLEIEARSQWAYARRRFFRHRLALGSLIVLIGIFLCGIFANVIAPYSYQEIPYTQLAGVSVIDVNQVLSPPSTKHLFGTDQAGRDTFSRALYGIRTSARVGTPRRRPLDGHRHDHRRPRRLLRRLDGQPADAGHRPLLDLTPACGAADRVEIPRLTAPRRKLALLLACLDLDPRSPASCAEPSCPCERRSTSRRRRRRGLGRPPDHDPPHAPEHDRADRRRCDARPSVSRSCSRQRCRSSASASSRRRPRSARCSTRARIRASTSGGSSPSRAS